MKRILALVSLSLFPLYSFADPALIASCKDGAEGVEWSAELNSSVPLFTSTIKLSSQPQATTTTYISSTSVCGVPMDFIKLCKTRIRSFQSDFSFEFTCSNGITGEVYTNGNSLNLSCSGTLIKPPIQNGFFDGCTITPPTGI